MLETSPFLIFTTQFDAIGIRYMIAGSVAATIYGEPRLTNAVDVVVVISDAHIGPLADAFPLTEFYLPPKEMVRVESARTHRGHFNIIHHATGYKADIYLAGHDALHEWGMANARRFEIDGQGVSVAPPEYVIVRKLEFYREGESEKHLKDIRAIVAGMATKLDYTTIETLVSDRGLTDLWESTKS